MKKVKIIVLTLAAVLLSAAKAYAFYGLNAIDNKLYTQDTLVLEPLASNDVYQEAKLWFLPDYQESISAGVQKSNVNCTNPAASNYNPNHPACAKNERRTCEELGFAVPAFVSDEGKYTFVTFFAANNIMCKKDYQCKPLYKYDAAHNKCPENFTLSGDSCRDADSNGNIIEHFTECRANSCPDVNGKKTDTACPNENYNKTDSGKKSGDKACYFCSCGLSNKICGSGEFPDMENKAQANPDAGWTTTVCVPQDIINCTYGTPVYKNVCTSRCKDEISMSDSELPVNASFIKKSCTDCQGKREVKTGWQCNTGYKNCTKSGKTVCLASSQCCTNSDCSAGENCNNGKCEKTCAEGGSASCSGQTSICDDDTQKQSSSCKDCSGVMHYNCVTKTCSERGLKNCNGNCIGVAECCGGCGNNQHCENGNCVDNPPVCEVKSCSSATYPYSAPVTEAEKALGWSSASCVRLTADCNETTVYSKICTPKCVNKITQKPANSSYVTEVCTDCRGTAAVNSGWSCNTGYTKSGDSCVENKAEDCSLYEQWPYTTLSSDPVTSCGWKYANSTWISADGSVNCGGKSYYKCSCKTGNEINASKTACEPVCTYLYDTASYPNAKSGSKTCKRNGVTYYEEICGGVRKSECSGSFTHQCYSYNGNSYGLCGPAYLWALDYKIIYDNATNPGFDFNNGDYSVLSRGTARVSVGLYDEAGKMIKSVSAGVSMMSDTTTPVTTLVGNLAAGSYRIFLGDVTNDLGSDFFRASCALTHIRLDGRCYGTDLTKLSGVPYCATEEAKIQNDSFSFNVEQDYQGSSNHLMTLYLKCGSKPADYGSAT